MLGRMSLDDAELAAAQKRPAHRFALWLGRLATLPMATFLRLVTRPGHDSFGLGVVGVFLLAFLMSLSSFYLLRRAGAPIGRRDTNRPVTGRRPAGRVAGSRRPGGRGHPRG
jgi:hypothetical protein